MPYFRVMVEGKGINVPMDGDEIRNIIGFYTTRVVRAPNPDQAIACVKSMIINDWTIGPYAATNKGSPPSITVESISPDTWLRALFFKNTGHTFYTDGEGESET